MRPGAGRAGRQGPGSGRSARNPLIRWGGRRAVARGHHARCRSRTFHRARSGNTPDHRPSLAIEGRPGLWSGPRTPAICGTQCRSATGTAPAIVRYPQFPQVVTLGATWKSALSAPGTHPDTGAVDDAPRGRARNPQARSRSAKSIGCLTVRPPPQHAARHTARSLAAARAVPERPRTRSMGPYGYDRVLSRCDIFHWTRRGMGSCTHR